MGPKKQGRAVNVQNSDRIPPFISDRVMTWKTRLYVDEGATDVLSFRFEFPPPPWGITTSATNVELPFKSVRVASIKLWAMYRDAKGIPGNTINLTQVDRRGVKPIEMSDTASYNHNAFIKVNFPTDQPLGYYYTTSLGESNPELSIALPQGGVMEITYKYVLADGDAVRTVTAAGLTSARVYTNSLSLDLRPIGRTYAYPLAF